MAARRPPAPRSGAAREAMRPAASPTRSAASDGRGADGSAAPAQRTARRAGRPPQRTGRTSETGRPSRSRPAAGRSRGRITGTRLPVIRPVTVFAAVAIVLAVLMTPYLRPWLAQRAAISGQHQEVNDLRRKVQALQGEKQRWQDPEYVRARARERLNFVMPGDTGYVLLTPVRKPAPRDPRQQAASVAGSVPGATWYDAFWRSVQVAGTARPGPGATSGGGAVNGGR